MKDHKHRVVFITGPTAVGKTAVGLKLAGQIPCEFISADSMQVYKGMDIVTDKLPLVLRGKYPHHLVDIIPSSKEYNAAEFCKRAKKAVKEILGRKKLPVVIGGTGLYVNSLLYGIFEQKGQGAKDEGVRRRLSLELKEKGSLHLYKRLKKVDKAAASKISSGDFRRIARALEVYETTGQPISILQRQRKGLVGDYNIYLFGLMMKREELYQRIDQRVDFMVNAGLLDEVRRLLKKKLSATAYCCIGIREVEGFLKGQYDLQEAVRLIKRNSRHFAKRQMTWFNKNKDIEWFDVTGQDKASWAAEKLYERIQ